MTKTQHQTLVANVLDVLSFAASTAFLAALAQHVNHLNQVNQHLTAIYVSRSAAPGFTVGPDFQLVPLVFITALLLLAAIAVRRHVSLLHGIALAIFVSTCAVWFFGFHLVRI